MTINCGPAWYAPVCGEFDQTNYAFTPGVHGWQFPVDPYDGVYFSVISQGTSDNIRSAIGRADKRYFECTVDTAATLTTLPIIVGVVLAGSSNVAPRVGTATGTCGYRSTDGDVLAGGAVVATYLTYMAGNTGMMAIDGATGKIWFGLDGAWNGNPSAGTGQAATLGAATYFAAVGVDDQGQSSLTVTGRFLTGSTLFTPPSGFSCWDD